jgi:hypothetical protein
MNEQDAVSFEALCNISITADSLATGMQIVGFLKFETHRAQKRKVGQPS